MTIQGSAEWFAERLGKVTASRVSDLIAKTKTGWGASHEKKRKKFFRFFFLLPKHLINSFQNTSIGTRKK